MAQPQAFCFIPTLHGILSRATTDVHHLNEPISLPTRDIASEVMGIKLGVQRARTTTSLLPDITRAIEEQEVEIAKLAKTLSGLQSVRRELAMAEV